MVKQVQKGIFLALLCVSAFIGAIERRLPRKELPQKSGFILVSSAFRNGQRIPATYTCEGEDVSPPLRWEHAPRGTQSFVLLVDDPDSRGGYWSHWVVFNIPATVHEVLKKTDIGHYGAIEGTNGWRRVGWGGPCPPINEHRYIFTLYALDVDKLKLTPTATRNEVMRLMKGHILGQAMLMGLYRKAERSE